MQKVEWEIGEKKEKKGMKEWRRCPAHGVLRSSGDRFVR